MADTGRIDYEVSDGVARITITNIARANSLTYPMIQQLAECWGRAADDDGVRLAVLTGAGQRHFCAGADLTMVRASDTPYEPGAEHNQTSLSLGFPKPVIALVNGPAIGLGMQLALDCDLVLAVRTAFFREPRVAFGRPPVSVLQVTTELGFSEVVRLGVAGLPMPAERAFGLGIVSELVDDPSSLADAADRYVDAILALPADAALGSIALLRTARRRPGVTEAMARAAEQIENHFTRAPSQA
ncbi:MAG: hypothetical protein ABS81_09595 [Pseudonocardia sp. SCN 72-86]|nr:MAG: hypothetical protein ABS81_09595 [Pseudonocardia sp. SCN 72-86]